MDRFFFPALILSIYLSAWLIQQHLFLNWDIGHLLHAATLLMSGGNYVSDFFMPNPPIILYLYLPPLLIQPLFNIDLTLIFRLYIFLLATLSLSMCAWLSKAIFTLQDAWIRKSFTAALAAVFLIIPLYDFGQRDHLLVMLTMPYLLLVVYRLLAGATGYPREIFIGILAGLGFAIKPQFFIAPLLIECYYALRQKTCFAWLRPEVIAIIAVLTVHTLMVILFYPNYVNVIVPYLMRNYYPSIGTSWSTLLFNPLALFCYCAALFYFTQHKANTYKILSTVLLLALVGFLFSYFLQRTTFYYHLLPAFTISLLLLMILFGQLVLRPPFTLSDYCRPAIFSLFLLILLCYQVKSLWTLLIFSPATVFSFFGILFTLLLIAFKPQQAILKTVSTTFIILLLSYCCFYVAQRTPTFSTHLFSITVFILIALFSLFSQGQHKALGTHSFLAVLGTLLFIYPLFFSYGIYCRSVGYKEEVLHPLVRFMQTQPAHRSIYVFSQLTNYSSPLFAYTGSHLAQRLDCLWPTMGFVRRMMEGEKLSPQFFRDKNFYLNLIADDLYLQKPDLVFVDKGDQKLHHWDPHFDYLAFFSENKKFRQVWKAYHYLTSLENHPYYQLDVYQRVH